MSISQRLKGFVRNSLFARRDNNYPEKEEPDTVSTLESIASQVKQEAVQSRQVLDASKFFAPARVAASTLPEGTRAQASSAVAQHKKEHAMRPARLTADQYEKIIEKDLTVLKIVGHVIDRNVAIRSRLKTRSA